MAHGTRRTPPRPSAHSGHLHGNNDGPGDWQEYGAAQRGGGWRARRCGSPTRCGFWRMTWSRQPHTPPTTTGMRPATKKAEHLTQMAPKATTGGPSPQSPSSGGGAPSEIFCLTDFAASCRAPQCSPSCEQRAVLNALGRDANLRIFTAEAGAWSVPVGHRRLQQPQDPPPLNPAHPHSSCATPRRRWHDIGYIAVFVQFIGATLFQASVILGVPGVLPVESATYYGGRCAASCVLAACPSTAQSKCHHHALRRLMRLLPHISHKTHAVALELATIVLELLYNRSASRTCAWCMCYRTLTIPPS